MKWNFKYKIRIFCISACSVPIQLKHEYARIKLATANRLKIPVTGINGSGGCYDYTATLLLQISQDSLCAGHKQVHGRALSVLYET
jgi:hypothetical protein